jgi:DNA-binding transcriptional regulator GbsR (MarR family)
MNNLTTGQAAFIKQFEQYGYDLGLAPSFARVLAWLLICQPDQQSAEDIQRALQLSVGSVNNAVNALTRTGLLEKLTFPGDRRFYYHLQADSWRRVFESRVHALRRTRLLAEKGLELDATNQRLIKMKEFYTWAEVAFVKLLQESIE